MTTKFIETEEGRALASRLNKCLASIHEAFLSPHFKDRDVETLDDFKKQGETYKTIIETSVLKGDSIPADFNSVVSGVKQFCGLIEAELMPFLEKRETTC